jgi:signal transduction histidine kinase
MKISHKLIFGYLTIAVLMSSLGYVSIKIYNDIKKKVIQLNVDSGKEFELSDETLYAIERCQRSAHELFRKKYKIIYKPYEKKPEEREIIQAERNLNADVEILAHLLSETKILPRSSRRLADENGEKEKEIEEIKKIESLEWLNLKEKRYFYHWKYISYFIYLAEQKPDQAYAFFENTLEPHFRRNIAPIIDKYKQDAHAEMQTQYREIVEEYIPHAGIIIVVVTAFILFTVVFLGFWISRSVSKPIMKLTNAAVEIGKGQLDTKIDIKSTDEIGVLASAFNQMAYDLSRTTVAKDELEQRVEERTAELLDANVHLKREIEEHQRTEEALRESKEKLRLLSSQLLRAQEKERRRISLELHDELGQSLSLLKVQLSAVKRKLRPDQTGLGETLQETREHLDYVIENVRRLSRDLSPSILEDLGLSAAIEWLISDFARHYNISTSCDTENIDDFFSHEHQIIIYRIFQEILSNIRKHAEANQVSVSIKKQNGAIFFQVQDNGKGFDLTEVSSKNSTEKGMGLTAMYERALIVGSALDMWAQRGKGTKISFTIPLQDSFTIRRQA